MSWFLLNGLPGLIISILLYIINAFENITVNSFSFVGLCNSKKIDKLLLEYGNSLNLHKSDCEVCKEQSQKLSMQIRNADKDLVLDKILEMCGHAGSYSDACRVMVLDDFEDIYQ